MTNSEKVICSAIIIGIIFTSLLSLVFLALSLVSIVFGADNQTGTRESLIAGFFCFVGFLMFALPSTCGAIFVFKKCVKCKTGKAA